MRLQKFSFLSRIFLSKWESGDGGLDLEDILTKLKERETLNGTLCIQDQPGMVEAQGIWKSVIRDWAQERKQSIECQIFTSSKCEYLKDFAQMHDMLQPVSDKDICRNMLV